MCVFMNLLLEGKLQNVSVAALLQLSVSAFACVSGRLFCAGLEQKVQELRVRRREGSIRHGSGASGDAHIRKGTERTLSHVISRQVNGKQKREEFPRFSHQRSTSRTSRWPDRRVNNSSILP